MSYGYIIHEFAQKDYEDSLAWYMERSIQAAENFTISIDYALKQICDYPDRWRNSYKNYYEYSLKKFPFKIVYVKEDDKKLIIVTAIYHHKRNPRKKYR